VGSRGHHETISREAGTSALIDIILRRFAISVLPQSRTLSEKSPHGARKFIGCTAYTNNTYLFIMFGTRYYQIRYLTMGPGPGLVARVVWLYCMRLASSGVGGVRRVRLALLYVVGSCVGGGRAPKVVLLLIVTVYEVFNCRSAHPKVNMTYSRIRQKIG